jgi:hypothetical protein
MSSTRNRDATVIWLGLAAFAGSMLFVWQGLDFTDMGFWLTGYRDFYTRPVTMGGRAVCWLSYFISHWVGVALGGGVLAYKVGYVPLVTASAIISYRLLAYQFGPSRLLGAMVLLTVFFTKEFGGNWIGYNELTALFYLAGGALVFCGLVSSRKLLVVLAGIVLGGNLFVRLPNLLGITLVSAVWLHAWAYRWSLRELLIWSAWFLSGFAFGIALILCLIAVNGHCHIFFQALRGLFEIGPSADSADSASGMFRRFITDHVRAFDMALPLVVFGAWLASWAARQKTLRASAAVAAGTLLLVFALYRHGYWPWIIAGLCYVILLAVVFRESRKDRRLALLAFIAGMVLLLAPLGSNNGIINAVYGMWLALPLTLILLWRSSDLTIGQFSMKTGGFRVFAMTVMLALFFQSLATAWRHTYLDSKNRFAMTHSIAHPLLAGTYTTAERAKVVTELLDAMPHFTEPGDEVLAYNAIPLVHYLTGTHPWLRDPWPDLVSAKKLAVLIRQKEQSGARLPCVVRATGSTYTNSWPIAAQPLATWWHQDEPRRVFAEFEQRHRYVVAWTNEFFEILTPVH